jgi:hypothetical protein
MISRTVTGFAFSIACLTAISAIPVAGPAIANDVSSGWSAQRNVLQSQRYDRLLETNLGFRKARMRRECGPVTDPELRQNCLASFNQDEPFVGSSTPRRHYPSGAGR